VCLELRDKANGDRTFMSISRIITGDESWICGYNPETNRQSSQWKSPQSPRAKKGAVVPEFNKEHAHCFFFRRERDCSPWIWSSWNYCEVLRCLSENVRRKRPELRLKRNWVLRHDNAPAHMSLKSSNMAIVPHPPYSPDLASCDFALFPKLKMKLKGRCSEIVSDIQRESQAVLDNIKHGAL
jgi:histone-lysine N-methyltransferase SETMAR